MYNIGVGKSPLLPTSTIVIIHKFSVVFFVSSSEYKTWWFPPNAGGIPKLHWELIYKKHVVGSSLEDWALFEALGGNYINIFSTVLSPWLSVHKHQHLNRITFVLSCGEGGCSSGKTNKFPRVVYIVCANVYNVLTWCKGGADRLESCVLWIWLHVRSSTCHKFSIVHNHYPFSVFVS